MFCILWLKCFSFETQSSKNPFHSCMMSNLEYNMNVEGAKLSISRDSHTKRKANEKTLTQWYSPLFTYFLLHFEILLWPDLPLGPDVSAFYSGDGGSSIKCLKALLYTKLVSNSQTLFHLGKVALPTFSRISLQLKKHKHMQHTHTRLSISY